MPDNTRPSTSQILSYVRSIQKDDSLRKMEKESNEEKIMPNDDIGETSAVYHEQNINIAIDKCSISTNISDQSETNNTKDSIMDTISKINDKDKLIEFLQNELIEKNRREEELSLEIEKLKSLLK